MDAQKHTSKLLTTTYNKLKNLTCQYLLWQASLKQKNTVHQGVNRFK